MKPLSFSLLADENIHPEVVAYLQEEGKDVVTAREVGLGAGSDAAILQYALAEQRVILTHDSDFGRLAFVQQEEITDVIFLRPGHIQPDFTIASLQYLSSLTLDVQFPFIIVVEHAQEDVRVRVREW